MLKKIIAVFLAICIMLGIGCSFVGCSIILDKASNYSEYEHLQRVSDLVEKRYMKEDGKYSSYEVYPVYNGYDELRYFVVDFEPEGYIYILLQEKIILFGVSMYTRSDGESKFWRPYTFEPGMICTIPDENGELKTYYDVCFKKDENGNYYGFRVSHFKAANIKNEKRYLLNSERGYIPAVRRGDEYINLVSWDKIEYPVIEISKYAVSNIGFVGKSYFNL